PPQMIPIRVPCTSRLDPLLILEAFSHGADGVVIIGCYETDCHYRTGMGKAKERVEKMLPLLKEMDIDPARVIFESTSASEGNRLAEIVRGFVNKVIEMGPLGSELTVTTKRR
ncbi:MAG: hydrogenase iron-sulfur subunit, partial [Promethearchaeota archaeon]